MENNSYTIEEQGMLKILEHLYSLLENERVISTSEISSRTGLDKRHWVLLKQNGIVMLINMVGNRGRYIWTGIKPNIKMASELLKKIPLDRDQQEIDKSINSPDLNHSKNIRIVIEFDNFWKLYDKKEDKIKCEKEWNKLKQRERDLIFEKLPAYINATPDKTYRKNPLNYLKNKCWENEIITYIKPTSNEQKNISIEFALSNASNEQLIAELKKRGAAGKIVFSKDYEF